MATEQTYPADPPLRRPNLWLWGLFGAVVGVIACIVVLNWWNSRLALTAERLAQARQLWRTNGPANYDLEVSVKGKTQGRYTIQVRQGKVTAATCDGQPFEKLDQAYPWTVSGLFEVVLQADLEELTRPDRRPFYTRVEFDPVYGHPTRYLRSGEGHQVQIEVKLNPQP
ncbi:MAG: DUF6174 domain-containing protein [Gemmatales bacterium]|nr:DUF6174 domain-containing protein [Gemmatales bacterium]MDW8385493.1 DUF6174 domain-containing protein [Gemmatales bacterium]